MKNMIIAGEISGGRFNLSMPGSANLFSNSPVRQSLRA